MKNIFFVFSFYKTFLFFLKCFDLNNILFSGSSEIFIIYEKAINALVAGLY